jgi:hypothetical protein
LADGLNRTASKSNDPSRTVGTIFECRESVRIIKR